MGGGFTEFAVEFKFAKIQKSYVEGGWVGGGGLWNLMLSSNLLKSKFPMLRVGGWVGGSRNLMPSSNLLKSKVFISMSPPLPLPLPPPTIAVWHCGK